MSGLRVKLKPPFKLTPAATHLLAAALGAGLLAIGCWLWRAGGTPSAIPPDPDRTAPENYSWQKQPAPVFPIPPYAVHLAEARIVLDPGHGGHGGRPNWKCGPTGLREAEVNLRVAQYLREFLVTAGAEVHMTRDADVYLAPDTQSDNRLRVALANRLRADLYLSIHHNGSDKAQPNYTALFYHGAPDHNPASLCAARHILTGLNDALRLEQHLPCALLSDSLLARQGLQVLREARVPAVLSESCFHSNPEQERRLRAPVYCRREAYGYFLGLARWAQAGLPRVRLVPPTRGARRVAVELDDGLTARSGWGHELDKIVAGSLVVRVNTQPVPFTYDSFSQRVWFDAPNPEGANPPRIYVDFENIFGQHVLHPRFELSPGR
ncbi:MAG: N-acetylmuramoyl-L-alanine amidase [Planctomycetota bacterium]